MNAEIDDNLSGSEVQQSLPEELFQYRMFDTINSGAQAVMISIGHKARLFDVMAELGEGSSHAIAQTAKLDERYVREWLAVMVTAHIVQFKPENKTYILPQEQAASLTRSASLGNVAVYAQFISLLGAVEAQTLECLKHGGGTQYSDYPCFHHIMAEDSAQSVVSQLFDTILPLVPNIESRLNAGIHVLDAGCGKGWALISLAERFPNSHFTGYDLCGDAIQDAVNTVNEKRLNNIHFKEKDLSDFCEKHRYDFITSFDAIHDQKDPQKLVCDIAKALKPGGAYLMQDIGGSAYLENNLDFPLASLLYSISMSHCTPVSLGQGGEGMGAMWGWETAKRMLVNAGFEQVNRHTLDHDPMNVWFVSHVRA